MNLFTLNEKLTLLDLQQERLGISKGLLDYIRRFRDLSLMCYDLVEEQRLVDICIAGMLYEYQPYLENLQIWSFIRLVEASRRTGVLVKKPSKGSTSQTTNATRQPWKWESKNVEVVVVEEPKKTTKGKKREKSSIPLPFSVSAEELYSILEAWVKDRVVVLPECKREWIEEEKRGALYYRYHWKSDHHTMDYYALRNIFHEKMAKGDLVKNGKCIDQRMRKPEVAMTFFIGCNDPMKEEAENMASSSVAPTPLHNEEMMLQIQQGDKMHAFLERMGIRPLARREVAQAMTWVMERS